MTTESRPDPVAQAVATLIHAAGRRVDPPAADYDIVLAAAEGVWRGKVQRRRRWRIGGGLAAALAVSVLVAGVLRVFLPGTTPVEVARVARLIGEADVRAPGAAEWSSLAGPSASLVAGARLRTREQGVAALTLADGVSLRVASMTEVELGEDARVRLSHGAVYADTGPGDGGAISVVTAAGTAHDFGTQFEVRYEHERLQLRVREGRVALLRDSDRTIADAGTQLAVDASGDLSRIRIARSGPDWQWAEAVAPTPDLDGQPVSALLEWVARETGRTLHYASAEVERQAATTVLHGKIGQMAPLTALDTMLATTDLTCELGPDGTIEVRRR